MMELYASGHQPQRRRGIAEHNRRLEAQEKERRDSPSVPANVVPKGTCPQCLEHIGRGIAFHKRYCMKLEGADDGN